MVSVKPSAPRSSRKGRSLAEATATTRRALLGAAATLFAERGYANVTLDEVAADAGVTKGAVYHHFGGKIAVFEAVFLDQEERIHARMREVLEEAPDPLTAARAGLGVFLDACADGLYGPIVFRDGPRVLSAERWQECERDYGLAVITQILRAVDDAGALAGRLTEVHAPVLLGMLTVAGQLLADAAPADQGRIRADLFAFFEQVQRGLLGVASEGREQK